MTSDDIKGALMLAATGVVAYLVWSTYRGTERAVDGATSAVGRAVDSVTGTASKIVSSITGAAGSAVDSASVGAATVGSWVNPVADTNLAYRTVNAVGGFVAGDTSWYLGGATYDLVHSKVAETAVGLVNPVADTNMAYRAVSAVGELATGKKDWSLGTAAYDYFNP